MPMMKPEEVRAFLDRKGWSDSEMERQSGYSRNTLAKYKEEGAPLQFALVCAALEANLMPWSDYRGPATGHPLVEAIMDDPWVRGVDPGTEIRLRDRRKVLVVEYEFQPSDMRGEEHEAFELRYELQRLIDGVIEAKLFDAVVLTSHRPEDGDR